jgi:hypothetical protein
MVSIRLTGINGRGNHFFPLLGALALSPSHGEVGGRLFFCGGPHPQATESRGGRVESQKCTLALAARSGAAAIPAPDPASARQPEGQELWAACGPEGSYLSPQEA